MSTQTFTCGACGGTVPPGRLSCPTCGELLAASPIATAPMTPIPGAYVPPVLTPVVPTVVPPIRPIATTVAVTPAGAPAPARAWAGHAPQSDGPNPAEASAPNAVASIGAASIFDPSRLADLVGWLAIAGAALIAVGFLLPWSDSVIGASGVEYFDRWGLAGPLHPFVAVGVLTVLALAIVAQKSDRDPVPAWLRIGLPGLGLGALLVGLVWPYLVGPLGAGPGVMAVTVGALLFIVAGIVAIVDVRHVRVDLAV